MIMQQGSLKYLVEKKNNKTYIIPVHSVSYCNFHHDYVMSVDMEYGNKKVYKDFHICSSCYKNNEHYFKGDQEKS
jgi:hypothetical protein